MVVNSDAGSQITLFTRSLHVEIVDAFSTSMQLPVVTKLCCGKSHSLEATSQVYQLSIVNKVNGTVIQIGLCQGG